jgi:hypothetical protein
VLNTALNTAAAEAFSAHAVGGICGFHRLPTQFEWENAVF